MKNLGFILIFAGFIACNSSQTIKPKVSHFETDKVFKKGLTIEGMCENGRRVDGHLGLPNCIQSFKAKTDGFANLMLSDVMNIGEYEIKDSNVIYTDLSGAEVTDLVFKLKNENELIDSDGNIWRTDLDDSPIQVAVLGDLVRGNYIRNLTIDGHCIDGKRVEGKFGFPNCTQQLSILDGNQVTMIVTDIVNIGTFKVLDNNILRITFESGPELQVEIFEILEEGVLLDENKNEWILRDAKEKEIDHQEANIGEKKFCRILSYSAGQMQGNPNPGGFEHCVTLEDNFKLIDNADTFFGNPPSVSDYSIGGMAREMIFVSEKKGEFEHQYTFINPERTKIQSVDGHILTLK
jgi:hypothetical protein